jgi:transcriptional regulator with XRE-family HTH domain
MPQGERILSNSDVSVTKQVGCVMRRLRVKKNMTQASLAFDADINVSYYCAVENGENNISFRKFLSICEALSEPADHVVSLILDSCEDEDGDDYHLSDPPGTDQP